MPDKKYILSIDQSTQGTKALIYHMDGTILARCDCLHKQMIDDLGWVEHDPDEILNNVYRTVQLVVEKAKIHKDEIIGVGISNQRETVMAWDKETGRPVYPAIVWQCARGEKICERIKEQGWAVKIKKATGLHLSPYFSAAKLAWIMENVAGVKEKSEKGELCCGTMDSWLVYSLTKGKSFKTDFSNASRTQLFNITDLCWDEEICNIFGIQTYNMPEVCDSNAFYGSTDFNGYLSAEIPIHAVMGDSHAALFGQHCLEAGGIKSTYGTGSSVMLNTGGKQIRSKNGLVTSIAWRMNGEIKYVLEGNINYTGAVISWLKNDLGLIDSPQESERLAKEANPIDKTYFVPAFTGLGAPYWDSEAKGIITGMSRVTGRKEIVRAALDSIVYQISDIVKLMQEEAEIDIRSLRVDGGPTKNKYLMSFQSDILNLPVEVPGIEELSASGVAYAAGIALGVYKVGFIFQTIQRKKYIPKMQEERRKNLYLGWRGAVRQTVHYHEN